MIKEWKSILGIKKHPEEETVDTKVIKLEMDINEIDRALTEIEGGLDRIIDKLSGEDK